MIQVQTAVCRGSQPIPERGIKVRGVPCKLLLHTVNKFQATAIRDSIYFSSHGLGHMNKKTASRVKW